MQMVTKVLTDSLPASLLLYRHRNRSTWQPVYSDSLIRQFLSPGKCWNKCRLKIDVRHRKGFTEYKSELGAFPVGVDF